MKDIIKRLELQRAAIEKALSALKEADGTFESGASEGEGETEAAAPKKRGRRRKGGMTAEGRKRLSEALKARWAAKRAGDGPSGATVKRRGRRKSA